MSSPTTEIFFVYSLTTGVPLSGVAGGMTFDTYKREDGVDVSQPVISEIGGGIYGFTPVFPSGHGIAYILNTGTGAAPARVARYMRPEDYASDGVPAIATDVTTTLASVTEMHTDVDSIETIVTDIQSYTEGRWKIWTTGPDTNRLVVYQPDGVTVLKKYDLIDSTGAPSVAAVFARNPV